MLPQGSFFVCGVGAMPQVSEAGSRTLSRFGTARLLFDRKYVGIDLLYLRTLAIACECKYFCKRDLRIII